MRSRFSSTHKKVVIRKLDKTMVRGFVNPTGFSLNGAVELLDVEGRRISLDLRELKGVYFVREFEGNPHRAERKVFNSRPRTTGLWIRMTFHDNEVMEGLVSRNLLELDGQGLLVTPPDMYSNNLRIFVPRNALREVNVLGVIGENASRRGRKGPAPASGQPDQYGLFLGGGPKSKQLIE